ncbi:MAG: PCRF domain-containing protein, partial [Candidatus Eisenbacteria bacterium]
MFEKLHEIKERFDELAELLMDPAVLSDRNLNKKYSKERASIEKVVTAYEEYEKVTADIAEAQMLVESSDDAEEKEYARAELNELKPREA